MSLAKKKKGAKREVTIDTLREAIREAKEKAKKRNFLESMEILISIKDVNLKDPANRFQLDITLPHKPTKPFKVAAFVAGPHEVEAKELGIDYYTRREIETIATNKREAKKLAKRYDHFLVTRTLLPIVVKLMGRYLGPRGKMPVPVPENAPLKPFVERYQKTVRVRLRTVPIIYARFGTRDMDDDKLAENARTIYRSVVMKLPKGERNIKHVYVKTTMGPAVRVV